MAKLKPGSDAISPIITKVITLYCSTWTDRERNLLGTPVRVKKLKYAKWICLERIKSERMYRVWSSHRTTEVLSLTLAWPSTIFQVRQSAHSPDTFGTFSYFQKSNPNWNEQDIKTSRNSKRIRRGSCSLFPKKEFQEFSPQWKRGWIKCVVSEENYFEGD